MLASLWNLLLASHWVLYIRCTIRCATEHVRCLVPELIHFTSSLSVVFDVPFGAMLDMPAVLYLS
jgi:hypothetical protein